MTESRWNADDLHPPLLNVQKPASAEIKFSTEEAKSSWELQNALTFYLKNSFFRWRSEGFGKGRKHIVNRSTVW